MQISVWEKESFYDHKDVIITGSGFVGLWSAYYLKQKYPRLRIAIIDRGVIPTGASTRNAGFACFGSLTELADDAIRMSEAGMLELVEMRYRGIKRIRKVFSKKQIEYKSSGGYELITRKDNESVESITEKIDWLNNALADIIKDKPVFRLADKKIDRFGFRHIDHLIENKLEGVLHSGKLCEELLRLVQSLGVTVLPATAMLAYENYGKQIRIITNHKIDLSCDQLLICTNGFAKELLPALDVVPARGQVLVTAPIDGLKIKGAFHFDEGFYYFRNLGNRVLLGGARNKAFEEEHTSEMVTTEKIQQELERYLSEVILPGIPYRVAYRWSGIMGLGSEKMPIVRELTPNVFCAVRMSGMGVALAPVIGEKVCKIMRG
ncbi:MAG TPA: FAD-dependent oxidoreductase [Flavitalea sp.]|nr:FAD-dependent oxidoreductase [Flavitalea sp.]